MDKNFVNVDDLVRQRLSGGEEKERAGAWMRMSELLEQEEKSRPVGLYWRRMFGALGVLFLITSVTVGGYKMSNSFHNGNSSYMPLIAANNVAKTNGSDAVNENSPATKSENSANSESKVSLTTTGESTSTNNSTTNNITSSNTTSNNKTSTNTNNKTSSNSTSSNKTSTNTNNKTSSNANTNSIALSKATSTNIVSTSTTASISRTPTNNHSTGIKANNQPLATTGAIEATTASTASNNQPSAKSGSNNSQIAATSGVNKNVGTSKDNKIENLVANNQPTNNKAENTTKSDDQKAGNTSSIGALGASVGNNTSNGTIPGIKELNKIVDADKSANSKEGLAKTNNNDAKTNDNNNDHSQVKTANNNTPKSNPENNNTGNKTGKEQIAATNGGEKGHGHKANRHSNTNHNTSAITGNHQNTDTKVANANKPTSDNTSVPSSENKEVSKTAIAKNSSEPVKKSRRHHSRAINNSKQAIANKNTTQPKTDNSASGTKDGDRLAKTQNKVTENQVANNNTKSSAKKDDAIAVANNNPHKNNSSHTSTSANTTTSEKNNTQTYVDAKNSVAKTTGNHRTNRRNAQDIKKMNQMALAANTGGNTGNGAKTSSIANNDLPTHGNNSKNTNLVAKTNTGADNNPVAKNDQKSSTGNKQGAKGGSIGTASADATNNSTQKHIAREMQVIVLKQSRFRSEPNHKDFKFDTISNDKIIEYATNEDNISNEAGDAGKNSYAANSGSKNAFGKTKNALGSGSSTETKQSKDGSLKAGDNEAALDAAKNISAAFNDIKYKVGNAIFAPGITAGINGTFFGPNSFKGFQFGITGKFIFGEDLSIMGELKYFNRSNNDYAMTDNYYRYIQNQGSNTFSKEQVSNTFSFSTLHSFEMPISVRYMVGNFDFFGGFNIIYNLGINIEEAPPIVANPVPGTFTQIGNDSKPVLAVSDFDSKFGLGYLFGFSYQLSPNLALDIRSVQTFWNSGGGTGSKLVSDQLYKSPSLQLSLGYRLGGRNIKD